MNIDEDETLVQTDEDRKELERRLFGESSDGKPVSESTRSNQDEKHRA